MAWHVISGQDHQDLIKQLRDEYTIKSAKVAATMLAVDRASFSRLNPYSDAPQPIGFGATISAPHMHAYALEVLKDHLVEGQRALDVGSGSGYLTVCMAVMVGETGQVVGIDHIPELVAMSITNVKGNKPGFLESGRITLLTGDGRQGYPNMAPYNAIHVGAAAPELPHALVQQLKVGGRLVIPVGPEGSEQYLEQIDKVDEGQIRRQSLVSVMYVPLTSKERQFKR